MKGLLKIAGQCCCWTKPLIQLNTGGANKEYTFHDNGPSTMNTAQRKGNDVLGLTLQGESLGPRSCGKRHATGGFSRMDRQDFPHDRSCTKKSTHNSARSWARTSTRGPRSAFGRANEAAVRRDSTRPGSRAATSENSFSRIGLTHRPGHVPPCTRSHEHAAHVQRFPSSGRPI